MKIIVCFFCLTISTYCQAQSNTETENIFIITTDGFRWQEVFNGADAGLIANQEYVEDSALLKSVYWDSTASLRRKKLMPFLWNTVAREGHIYGNRTFRNNVNVSNLYKISYPGYNEMLSGYADPFFIPNVPIRNRNTNILEYLNAQKEFCGRVAAFSSWNIFSAILNKKRSKLPGDCGYEKRRDDSALNNALIDVVQENDVVQKHTRYDMLTYLSAREYIETKHPRVVLIGFGETDEFAHSGRYDLYLQQATNVDKMIADLWYLVQTTPCYRNKTTFIITTDHGRGRNPLTWYKHGIFTGGSGESWLALLGPGISPAGEMKTAGQYYEKQVAETIAILLGERFETTGKTKPFPSNTSFNLVFGKETK